MYSYQLASQMYQAGEIPLHHLVAFTINVDSMHFDKGIRATEYLIRYGFSKMNYDYAYEIKYTWAPNWKVNAINEFISWEHKFSEYFQRLRDEIPDDSFFEDIFVYMLTQLRHFNFRRAGLLTMFTYGQSRYLTPHFADAIDDPDARSWLGEKVAHPFFNYDKACIYNRLGPYSTTEEWWLAYLEYLTLRKKDIMTQHKSPLEADNAIKEALAIS